MPAPMPIIMPVVVSSGDNGAKKVACENLFHIYDAKTASVQQMQTYADCVKEVYPKHDPLGAKALVAALLIAALIGAVVGVVKARSDFGTDLEDMFMGGMLGALCGPLLIGVLGIIGAALAFVFS